MILKIHALSLQNPRNKISENKKKVNRPNGPV
jgi:hypothetical protein